MYYCSASQRRADPRNAFLNSYTSLQCNSSALKLICERRGRSYPGRILDLGLSARRLIFQRSMIVGHPAGCADRVEIQDAINEFRNSLLLFTTHHLAQRDDAFSTTSTRQIPLLQLYIIGGLLIGLALGMHFLGCSLFQTMAYVSLFYLGLVCSPLQLKVFICAAAISISIGCIFRWFVRV